MTLFTFTLPVDVCSTAPQSLTLTCCIFVYMKLNRLKPLTVFRSAVIFMLIWGKLQKWFMLTPLADSLFYVWNQQNFTSSQRERGVGVLSIRGDFCRARLMLVLVQVSSQDNLRSQSVSWQAGEVVMNPLGSNSMNPHVFCFFFLPQPSVVSAKLVILLL